jgi:predicted DNA-binding protein
VSDTTPTKAGKGYKTLAIRLDDDVHARLQLVARLKGSSIAAEISQAIDAHLEATKADPELSNKAQAVLDDIEREAEARQKAISDLFADTPTKATRTKKTTS